MSGLSIAVLLAVALLARTGRLGEDVWADEGWYFHLARTWGSEGHRALPQDEVGAQIAYRPLFFVLFFPLAQLGLTAARVGNLLVSLGLVVATWRLTQQLGAGRLLAVAAGLIIALNPACAQFGVILTTDNLSSFFLVLAVSEAASRRYGFSAALMSAAVLCKESSVVVAAGVLVACLLLESRRANGQRRFRPLEEEENTERRSPIPLLVPLLLVAITQVVGQWAFRGRMPGWGTNLDIQRFLAELMLGPPAILVGIILLARRRLLVLAAAASLPLFYLVWTLVFHRGVVGWYGVPMLPFVVAAYSVALRDAASWLAARLRLSLAWQLAIPPIGLLALAPWSDWTRFIHWSWMPPTREGLMDAAKAVADARPRKLSLASCFWTFAHFPLRPSAATAWKHNPPGEQWTADSIRLFQRAARGADVIVYCPAAVEAARAEGLDRDCRLFENDRYIVVRGGRACELASAPKGPNERRKRPLKRDPSPQAIQAPVGLVRTLGAEDMRLARCAQLNSERIVGSACSEPFPIYGPYLSVPAGSLIDITLEVEAHSDLTIHLEVVSSVGRHFHGALLPEALLAGEERLLSYRIRTAEPAEALETRVVIESSNPATFDIRAFRLEIREPEPVARVNSPTAAPSGKSR